MTTSKQSWLPPTTQTQKGKIRRAGVELEFAGLSADQIAASITRLYSGKIKQVSALHYTVDNSKLGDFTIELDASYLQALAAKQHEIADTSLINSAIKLINKAAEQLVPWEVVSPPIPIDQLHQLEPLIVNLREHGALGTGHALHYAFGLHLNPELPAVDVATVLSYLRAYLCLYDWIITQDKIDTTRKLTTYIKHFDKTYIDLVLAADYRPTMSKLINDYLLHNPSRNRSLDLLPLFAYIDKDRVAAFMDDPRIKPRPTFHYRLPNCDIDNPDWNLLLPWSLWLQVEVLAGQTAKLETLCQAYRERLPTIIYSPDKSWVAAVTELLDHG